MIKVDITSKRYGTAQVLGPIAFEVAAGETVALVGPSGIGKSTLLRLISGLDADFEGTVTKPDAMAFVFQEPTLLPWRSSIDNLRLVHPDLPADEAERALEQVGLGTKGDLFPGQLSLGQQRRLSLARAFASTPDLLILDEPFASLDKDIARTMISLTETLIKQHRPATLLVTHDMSEAEQLANRILTLSASPFGATLEPSREMKAPKA
jgi:NitT/TauT family transport system ATP-binding protein